MRCERRQGWLLVLVLCWPVDSSRPVFRLPSVGVVAGSGCIPFADMAMRRGPPARGGPAGRRAWAATLVWSDDELHVLEVAEQMRRRGDAIRAGHMVAVDCPLPARLNRHDFLHCTVRRVPNCLKTYGPSSSLSSWPSTDCAPQKCCARWHVCHDCLPFTLQRIPTTGCRHQGSTCRT